MKYARAAGCTLALFLALPGQAVEVGKFPANYPHLARPAQYVTGKHLVLVSADPFDTVASYYLNLPARSSWRRVSPTAGSLEAWRRGNVGDGKGNQVIVIILIKPKPKIKCMIEIGRLRSASRSAPLTIISIRI